MVEDKSMKRQNLKKKDYKVLLKICKKNNIKFLTSIFNHRDYELISSLNLKEIKFHLQKIGIRIY